MNARADEPDDGLSSLFGGLADTAPAHVTPPDDERWPTAPRSQPPTPRADPPTPPADPPTSPDTATWAGQIPVQPSPAFDAPRPAAGSPSAGSAGDAPAFPLAPPPTNPAFPPPAGAAFPPPSGAAYQPTSAPPFGSPSAPPSGAAAPPSFGASPASPASPPAPAAPTADPEPFPRFPPAPATPPGYPPTTPIARQDAAGWPADPHDPAPTAMLPQFPPTEPWTPERDPLPAPAWAPHQPPAVDEAPPTAAPPEPAPPPASAPPASAAPPESAPPEPPIRRPEAFAEPPRSSAPTEPAGPREDPRSVSLPAAVAPAMRDPGAFRPPPGPLLPSTEVAGPESIEELERPTGRDWLGLALAVLVPPVGIVLAIANAVSSSRRRGWVIGVVKASVAIGVVTTIVSGLAAAAGLALQAQGLEHDRIAAESADFCAALDAVPESLESPTLGWPAPAGSIPDTIAGMQAYAGRMSALAAVAPEGVRGGVVTIVSTAGELIVDVSTVRSVDGAANDAAMAGAVTQSGVVAWHAEYCR